MIQGILASVFHQISNVYIKENGNDFEGITKFEKKLQISITVYDYGKKINRTPSDNTGLKIYLIHDGNHFNFIPKLTDAFKEKLKIPHWDFVIIMMSSINDLLSHARNVINPLKLRMFPYASY